MLSHSDAHRNAIPAAVRPGFLGDEEHTGETACPRAEGARRLQTQWTWRDEECDYSYTPVFAPEDQMSYTQTARGSTWQEKPEEATLSGVSLSVKAP